MNGITGREGKEGSMASKYKGIIVIIKRDHRE
jgi:hypothetical protein